MKRDTRLQLPAVDPSLHTPLEIPFCDGCGSLIPERMRCAAEGVDLDGLACHDCESSPDTRARRRACAHTPEVIWWPLTRSQFMVARCTCCSMLLPHRPGAAFMGTPALPVPPAPRRHVRSWAEIF